MTSAMQRQMRQKLTEHLTPLVLKIDDQSSRHAGHAGAQPGGDTHFALHIVSDKFAGLSRLQRHRLLYDLLSAELENGVHALQLNLKTPAEHNHK